MILWFRSTLAKQLLGIGLISMICLAFNYFLAPIPPVRLHWPLVIQGLIAGIFISVVLGLLRLLALFLFGKNSVYLQDPQTIFPRAENTLEESLQFLGLVCFSAIAEEVLFRGFVFNAALSRGVGVAFIVHSSVVVAANYMGRKRCWPLFLRVTEANFLAFAFFRSKSLTVCVSAHLIMLFFERFLLPLAVNQLPGNLSWRQMLRARIRRA